MAMGVVLAAVRKGWMTTIKTGENPYYAFRFLNDAFNQALQGGAPIFQSGPKWLWEICAALAPKEAPFKTGTISYKWTVSATGIGIDPVFPYAGPAYVKNIAWGTVNPSIDVNGLPTIFLPIPGSYDQQSNGVSSFTSMCRTLGSDGLNLLSEAPKNAYLSKDTSSFSVCYAELGSSYGTSGGIATTIYSERHIPSPIMAKFAEYQNPGEFYRGWHHAAKGAMSPTYIAPRFMEMMKIEEINDKVSPIVQVINFDEFFQTLSYAVGGAIEAATLTNGGTTFVPCPLSPQEAQLLLRQTMIPVFANYLAQDISLGTDFFPLLPFCVGPNGVPAAAVNMLLPTLLAENIRCSMRRKVNLKAPKGLKSILDIITILGRPANADQLGNYTTVVNGTPTPIYTNKSGEIPIDLIDMSYVSGSTTGFVSPTGETFSKLIADWNEWITRLSGNLSPLVTVASEAGVTALMTGAFTRTQQSEVQPNKKGMVKSKSTQKIRLGTVYAPSAVRVDPVTPSYLDYFTEKETFCNNKTFAVIWKYLSLMILPSALSIVETNTAGTQTWQTFQCLPYYIPANTIAGGTGGGFESVFPTIGSRLRSLAALDVKSDNQQLANEMISGLVELGKEGRGSFFSSIAGDLAGAFLPGLGGPVTAMLNAVGI